MVWYSEKNDMCNNKTAKADLASQLMTLLVSKFGGITKNINKHIDEK